jgi:hypothetical protein
MSAQRSLRAEYRCSPALAPAALETRCLHDSV